MVNERKKKRDEEENFLSDPEIKALVGEAEVRKIMLTRTCAHSRLFFIKTTTFM